MKWRFWRKPISCCQMGGWSFEFIHNTWISFASCLIYQNVCKTRDLLATVKLKLPTPLKSWTNTMLQCIDPALGSCCTCLQICRNASTWSDISQLVHQNPLTKLWWSWSIWLATWQDTLTNMFLWNGRACTQACYMTMSVKSLFWKSSVTQTGLQTETHADRFLAVQSSMVDALSTRLQGLRR